MTTEVTINPTDIETMTTATPLAVKAKHSKKAKPAKSAKVAKAPVAEAPKPAKTDEVSFREGTKRHAAYLAITRPEGCTLADATAFLKWAPSVCGSEFREVAKLVKRKLVRDEKGAYRLA